MPEYKKLVLKRSILGLGRSITLFLEWVERPAFKLRMGCKRYEGDFKKMALCIWTHLLNIKRCFKGSRLRQSNLAGICRDWSETINLNWREREGRKLELNQHKKGSDPCCPHFHANVDSMHGFPPFSCTLHYRIGHTHSSLHWQKMSTSVSLQPVYVTRPVNRVIDLLIDCFNFFKSSKP